MTQTCVTEGLKDELLLQRLGFKVTAMKLREDLLLSTREDELGYSLLPSSGKNMKKIFRFYWW